MSSRVVVARELAEIFKILSHPDRIRLVEELSSGERDVNTLHERLSLPAARVSQHLALMRAHRIVEERRDGRHVYYHLVQPEFAHWIVDGLEFLERLHAGDPKAQEILADARTLWSQTAH